MCEWVSDWDWDCDWETMEGFGAVLGCVDQLMVLLLSCVGGMTMCGAVDRRVNDVVAFSYLYYFGWWCI